MKLNAMEPFYPKSSEQSKNSKILGLHVVQNADEMVYTMEDEVLLCQVSSGKCLQNWMFNKKNSNSVSVPAVKCSNGDYFFGGCGRSKQSLIAWTKDDANLESKKSMNVGGEIMGIYPYVHSQNKVVVVLRNGFSGVYDENLSCVSTIREADKHELLWSNLYESTGKSIMQLASLFVHENQYFFRVSMIRTSKNGSIVVESARDVNLTALLRKHETIVTCAFVPENLVLTVNYTSGCMQMIPLKWTVPNVELVVVSNIYQVCLPQTKLSVGPKSKKRKIARDQKFASINLLKTPIVCVATAEEGLSFWDVKFQSKVAKPSFAPNSTPLGPIVEIKCLGNGTGVVVVYRCASVIVQVGNVASSFQSIFGACRVGLKDAVSNIQPALSYAPSLNWNLNSLSEGTVNQSEWDQLVLSRNVQEEDVIKELHSLKAKKDKTGFLKTFTEYASVPTKKSLKRKEALRVKHRLSYRFLAEVAGICIAYPELQLWEPLGAMVRTRRLSSRMLPNLLPTLMEYSQIDLLRQCLRHVADISESSCVRLIQYFFRTCSQRIDDSSNLGSACVERLICSVVSRQVNPVFVYNAVRQHLSFDEAVALLMLLKKFYYLTAVNDSVLRLTQEGIRIPTTDQIVVWIGILLDLYFNDILLECTSADRCQFYVRILSEMQNNLKTQVKLCRSLAQLQGQIGHFMRDVPVCPDAITDYTLDTILL